MINPRASIIMSTYNDGQYIKQSIESVLTQSFTNFEFIIINDCSTDNTEQIITDIQDKRIQYVYNERNKGLITNLNKGIAIAKGEYIARIDSDDAWIDPDKLKKQVLFLDTHPDYALIGSDAEVYTSDGVRLYTIIHPHTDADIRSVMLRKNCFVHSSVVFRKDVALSSGLYAPSEKYVEDYGLWLRMGQTHKMANVAEPSVSYLHNETGETQQHNLAQIQANIRMIQTYKKTYPQFFVGMLRWRMKYLVVRFGGLGMINRMKSHT